MQIIAALARSISINSKKNLTMKFFQSNMQILRGCNSFYLGNPKFLRLYDSLDSRYSIRVRDVFVEQKFGFDMFKNVDKQPLMISYEIFDFDQKSIDSDNIESKNDYETITRAIRDISLEKQNFVAEEEYIDQLANVLHAKTDSTYFEIIIKKPRAISTAKCIEIKSEYHPLESKTGIKTFRQAFVDYFVKNIRVNCIIGLKNFERQIRQPIELNISLKINHGKFTISTICSSLQETIANLEQHLSQSNYYTIEKLGQISTQYIASLVPCEQLETKVSKPCALPFAKSPVCCISKFNLENQESREYYLSLGSNIGDSVQFIKDAVNALENKMMEISEVSSMFLTAPQDLADQPNFVNAVIKVKSSLDPDLLLSMTQSVEQNFNRTRSTSKGPRTIDIDILFAEPPVHSNNSYLAIPHPRMLHREFVLRPLETLIDQPAMISVNRNLNSRKQIKKQPTSLIIPIKSSKQLVLDRTIMMAILNVTPDSFSGDGNLDVSRVVKKAILAHKAGASILDVGGYSTRPKCKQVSIFEEQSRVIPAIRGIREAIPEAIISVDTFNSAVAAEAVNVGANIINDISGGLFDAKMLELAAKLDVPICLGHTRGNPSNPTCLSSFQDVISEVAAELVERIKAAKKASVKRWNIILDPGFGFSKDSETNFAMLSRLEEIMDRNYGNAIDIPWVVGTSRKGYLDASLGISNNSDIETAAAIALCVKAGAHIVRVHNIERTFRMLTVLNKCK